MFGGSVVGAWLGVDFEVLGRLGEGGVANTAGGMKG